MRLRPLAVLWQCGKLSKATQFHCVRSPHGEGYAMGYEASMQRGTLLGWVGGTVVGVLLGGAVVLAFSMPGAGPGTLPALPNPAAVVSGKRDHGAPQLTGTSR